MTTYVVAGERYFTAYLRDISDRHRRAAYSQVLEAAGRALLEKPRDPDGRLGSIPALLVPRFAPFAAAAAAGRDTRPRVLSAVHADTAPVLAQAVLSGRAASSLWTETLSGEAGLAVFDLAATTGHATPHAFLRDSFDVSQLAVSRIMVGDFRGAILCGAPAEGFSHDDLRFLTEFCRRAELAIENAAVYRAAIPPPQGGVGASP